MVFTITGCATSKFKPEGLTEQQITESLSERRRISGNLPMGSPIKLSFYPGATDSQGQALGAEITGFFYAFNKMNDTISVSPTPLSLVNRGVPYYLDYIAEITLITPMLASRLHGIEHPTETEGKPTSLSMVGFQAWPDFERELLTQ